MTDWDQRCLNLARFISTWSKDPAKKVGAVVVDNATRRIVSMGYNGLPQTIPDTLSLLHNKKLKNKLTIHAEANALYLATKYGAKKDCTLYVWPAFPCSECAKKILQATFITRLVTYEIQAASSWAKEQKAAFCTLAGAKISLRCLPCKKGASHAK